jgi:LemA protein
MITVYNGLVELRLRVEQGWGQVDIQLKRRHDLIPNLVDCVKGYRDHEASTQEALAALRSQLRPPRRASPEPISARCWARSRFSARPIPSSRRTRTSSRCKEPQRHRAAHRPGALLLQQHRDLLQHAAQVVPDRFIAALGGMKPRALMEAERSFERAPVEVNFSFADAQSQQTRPPVDVPAESAFSAQIGEARAGYVALEQAPEVDELAGYKVFLCDLFAGHEDAAAGELAAFNEAGSNASYYFANAAWSLYNHKTDDARRWLTSASFIFAPDKFRAYAVCLEDLGYQPLAPLLPD